MSGFQQMSQMPAPYGQGPSPVQAGGNPPSMGMGAQMPGGMPIPRPPMPGGMGGGGMPGNQPPPQPQPQRIPPARPLQPTPAAMMGSIPSSPTTATSLLSPQAAQMRQVPLNQNLSMFGRAGQMTRPDQRPQAPNMRLTPAEMGRLGQFGDSIVAHLNPGEVQVPPQVQSPQLMQALQQAFAQRGRDMSQFTAGSPQSARNPTTGAPSYDFLSSIGGPLGGILGALGASFLPELGIPALLTQGLGGALGGGLGAAITGGDPLSNALLGGVGGAAGSLIGGGGGLGSLLGLTGGSGTPAAPGAAASAATSGIGNAANAVDTAALLGGLPQGGAPGAAATSASLAAPTLTGQTVSPSMLNTNMNEPPFVGAATDVTGQQAQSPTASSGSIPQSGLTGNQMTPGQAALINYAGAGPGGPATGANAGAGNSGTGGGGDWFDKNWKWAVPLGLAGAGGLAAAMYQPSSTPQLPASFTNPMPPLNKNYQQLIGNYGARTSPNFSGYNPAQMAQSGNNQTYNFYRNNPIKTF